MTERWTHNDVRDQAFEYRRGELEADKRESVEAHLESCDACRDYVEKLFTLMSSPPDVEAPSEDYADSLFGKIEAQIQADQRAEEQGAQEDEAVFAPGEPGFRWGTAAIGLAAGFLLAVGIGWLVTSSGMFSTDAPGEAPSMAEQQTESPGAADEEPEADSSEAKMFADLRSRPSQRPGVGILSSEDARWELEGEDDLVLDLERGTVLVEYLPREGRQFRVQAPDMRLRVVGTIFYVSANGDSTAGVITGAVEVDSEDGERVKVNEGQRVTSDGEVEPIPTDSADALRAQVDVRRHHAALRQRMKTERNVEPKADASEPQPARAKVARQAEKEDGARPNTALTGALAKRRADAEAAIRAGQYRRAEGIYSELIKKLDPAHPAAPSIHLDLAGLYLEQMDRPRKALPYLRGFLRKWPNDVASSAVQRRLCVVADELGEDEPRCDERATDK